MSVISREISEQDFRAFVKFAHDLAGISLSESKRHLLISRLIRRVRALQLPDIASYRSYLDKHLAEETGNFVNAITTNLTSFFRESYHFDYLQEWLAAHPAPHYQVWSAGCSTGQEPYSIAMTFDRCNLLDRVSIQATDIDTQVLDKAANGVYEESDIESFDHTDCQRWFQRGTGANAGRVRVKEPLGRAIDFKALNLLERWPGEIRYDVIFCRNVFIYFDVDTQAELLRRFADRLKPEGVLFLGHSEGIRSVEGLYAQQGRTTYRLAEAG